MSRKNIKLDHKLERLTILDKTGRADEAVDPNLDDDLSLYLYKLMVQSRALDERMINLQRQGRIGTYAPCRGQEACFCGATPTLSKDDWVVPAFREVGSFIHRGWPMESLMFYWGGYEEGAVTPEGVNDLPINVPIASQTVHAMGIAWGMQIREAGTVVLCYCGEGGTSEGDFHEAMNFAGVFRMPLVMLIENNQWAISVPRHMQTASPTIAQKSIAYGFDGVQVDGNDILGVYVATKEAVEKARSGGGPTLIEAVTYRMSSHTTADDPKKYRDDEEVERWAKLDPIIRYEKYLKKRNILDKQLIDEIQSDAQKQVADAVARFEAAREVDPLECFDYLLAELPAELVAQKEEFRRALQHEGAGKGH